MNRIFPLFLLIFALSACNKSNEEKAHDVVVNYCNNNFFSPEDYKPISFDSLKIYITPYEQTKDFQTLDEHRHKLEFEKDSLSALLSDGKKKAILEQQIDSLDKVMALININITTDKESFKGIQQGWTIRHSYTRKDDSGRITEGRSVFVLNRDLSKVILVTDE